MMQNFEVREIKKKKQHQDTENQRHVQIYDYIYFLWYLTLWPL